MHIDGSYIKYMKTIIHSLSLYIHSTQIPIGFAHSIDQIYIHFARHILGLSNPPLFFSKVYIFRHGKLLPALIASFLKTSN